MPNQHLAILPRARTLTRFNLILTRTMDYSKARLLEYRYLVLSSLQIYFTLERLVPLYKKVTRRPSDQATDTIYIWQTAVVRLRPSWRPWVCGYFQFSGERLSWRS